VFGSICLVFYLHSLCFDSTNQIIPYLAGGFVYLEAFALFSTSILFVLTQQIKIIPFPAGGFMYLEAFALFSTSILFVLTQQIKIIPFPAGGFVYLEAFALFSISILFVLTQQIKLFPSVVLRVWKPLPCSLLPFSSF
jgi:hypothetical protein